jgi:ubiquinol-cytochrome c reductase iron-sulfur subunit
MARVEFVASLVASLFLAAVYWAGGNTQLEGLLLAVSLGGLGAGIITIAMAYLPDVTHQEPRPQLASTTAEREETRAVFEAGEEPLLERRGLLRLLLGALAALGAVLLFPVRSLGPRPGVGLTRTAFQEGVKLVTADGKPVTADQLPIGGALTVFPEGHTEAADSPAVLIRVEERRLKVEPSRQDWTVEGLIAYSKICTHAGCPVGLYQAQSGLLLCPCHQSTFDVLNGARPTFGPATRPLPQLPIRVDDSGFIVAAGDYPEPVGPGYWDRS